MKTKIKTWWITLKTFDWKMYLALCLLALIPAIYQTTVTKLITSSTSPGALDIVGQMEWLLIPITCLIEIIRKDAGKDGYKLKQINYYSIATFVIIIWFILIPSYQWFFDIVEGIKDPNRIFEIVFKSLGFYAVYAYSQIIDAIFIGIGKTKYNVINSLLCNIIYYGLWFILYKTNVVIMTMDMIIIMFGCGNIFHWVISISEEKIFLKRELRRVNINRI